MLITIDAAEKNLRSKSYFYSKGFVKKEIKETCVICFDNDIYPDLMFLVGQCGHRFCLNCVKQHVQVKLLDGTIPNCLEHRCKSQLSIDSCNEILTPKLSLMWEQRIREDSTPSNERVYCPYPTCSYLLSKTDLLPLVGYGHMICPKCRGSYCIYCKVPWHYSLSCTDYKKLHPNFHNNDEDDAKLKSLASIKGWRQCSKCKHMVGRSYGCNHMICRCGHDFCYGCGRKWYGLAGGHRSCNSRSYHEPEDNAFTRFVTVLIVGLLLLHIIIILYFQLKYLSTVFAFGFQ